MHFTRKLSSKNIPGSSKESQASETLKTFTPVNFKSKKKEILFGKPGSCHRKLKTARSKY